jgi:hypothetical protein
MFKLITYSPFPPGEFSYEQTDGIYHKFEGMGLSVGQQAKNVLKFRTANQLGRATYVEVVQDIDAYTCARLKNNPQFVIDSDKPVEVVQPSSGGCSTCGVKP